MGRSRQTSTTTQSVPEWYQSFVTGDVFPAAREFAAQEFTPYEGEFVAGVSPLSMGTADLFSAMATPSAAGQQATSLYGGIAAPTEFGTRAAGLYGDITGQTAGEAQAQQLYGQIGSMAGMTPADYAALTQANMSPYQSQVIDAALARAQRERDIARTGEMADITRAGAFGNERRGVFEAERQAAFDIGQQQMIADLMAQGYNQAQAATMAQLGMQQGAAAQGAAGLAGLGGAQRAGQQAAAAGFAGLSQAERAAAEAAATGLSQAERDRLAALGQSAAGLTQLGNLEQLTQQAELDALYSEFMREQNLPLQQLGALSGAVGGVSVPVSTTQTQSSRPGFAGILGAAASLGQGAASLGWQPFG
jgi:hypothetical protein